MYSQPKLFAHQNTNCLRVGHVLLDGRRPNVGRLRLGADGEQRDGDQGAVAVRRLLHPCEGNTESL
jgi:hypothetical protein